MRTSEQIDQLITALAVAQGKIGSVEKNQTVSIRLKSGGEFSYQYTTLDKILEAIRKPFSENGLAIVQCPAFSDGQLQLTTRICHASGQWIECEMVTVPGDGDIKTVGGLITYLKRYSLAALVGIASDEDTDAKSEATIKTRDELPQQATDEEIEAFYARCRIELDLSDQQVNDILAVYKVKRLDTSKLDGYFEALEGQMNEPTCAPALVTVANARLGEEKYKVFAHLKNAVAKVDPDFAWPKPGKNNKDQWKVALAHAIEYASAPASEPEPQQVDPLQGGLFTDDPGEDDMVQEAYYKEQ